MPWRADVDVALRVEGNRVGLVFRQPLRPRVVLPVVVLEGVAGQAGGGGQPDVAIGRAGGDGEDALADGAVEDVVVFPGSGR